MGENDVVCVRAGECHRVAGALHLSQRCPHNQPHTYQLRPESCREGLCSFTQKVVHCQKLLVVASPSVHTDVVGERGSSSAVEPGPYKSKIVGSNPTSPTTASTGRPLKTRYEFIHFVKIADKPKTSVWSCRNNRSGDELGVVRFYPAWRSYTYFPTVEGVYSAGCLSDIIEFIGSLAKCLKGGGSG